jgi:membrane associated rhomboid family serine protease
MIPIGDSIRSRRAPLANWLLIIANFCLFFLELTQGPNLDAFFSRWALTPAALTGAISSLPGSPPPVLTLFSSMFLHGGWGHILGNMLFLWIFGDNVEDAMGSIRYTIFYFLCGIVAAMIQVFIAPASTIPQIGASGAVSGVLGAYIVMYPRARVSVVIPLLIIFPVIEIPAFVLLGVWFLTQFIYGIASFGDTLQTGGIAWWAHIGGFVAGIILHPFFRRRRRPEWPTANQ